MNDINSDISEAEENEKDALQELKTVQEQVVIDRQSLQDAQNKLKEIKLKLEDTSLSAKEKEDLSTLLIEYQGKEQSAMTSLLRSLMDVSEQSSAVISSIDIIDEESAKRDTFLKQSTEELKDKIDLLRKTLRDNNVYFETPLGLFKNVEKEKINLKIAEQDVYLLQEEIENNENNKELKENLHNAQEELKMARKRLSDAENALSSLDTSISDQDLQTIKALAIAEAEFDHQVEVNKLFSYEREEVYTSEKNWINNFFSLFGDYGWLISFLFVFLIAILIIILF